MENVSNKENINALKLQLFEIGLNFSCDKMLSVQDSLLFSSKKHEKHLVCNALCLSSTNHSHINWHVCDTAY